MDALTALQTRVSCPLLKDPGPTKDQIQQLIKAALRAPDHKSIRPWRFLLIEGEARHQMGEVLANALIADNPDADSAAIEKVKRKPLRAPAIVVVLARISEHPKVPAIEQIISAGAAANNIVTAAFALGIGAYWRTGGAAFHPTVKQGLGVQENEEITGFIYLGTPQAQLRPTPVLNVDEFIEEWQG